MLRKILSRSIQFSFLKNYLIMAVMLTAIVLVAMYAVVFRQYQNEIVASNVLILERAKQDIDEKLYAMYEIAVKIAEDEDLMAYNKGEESYNRKALMALKRYNTSAGLFDDVILGFDQPDVDYYYSPKSVYHKEFFSTIYNLEGLSSNEIDHLMNTIEYPMLFSTQSRSNLMGRNRYLIYAYPLSLINLSRTGVVFFIIDANEVTSIMMNTFEDTALSVFIVGMNGPFLTASRGETVDYEDISAAIDPYGRGSRNAPITVGKEKMTVYTVDSNYSNITYVTAIKQRDFFVRFFYMRDVVLAIIFAMLTLGMLVSWMLSSRSSKPIRDLAARIAPAVKTSGKNSTPNEIDMIEQWYCTNQLEKAEMARDLIWNNDLLRNNLLMTLIYENTNDLEMDYIYRALGLVFIPDFYILAAAQLDNAGIQKERMHPDLAENLGSMIEYFQLVIPEQAHCCAAILTTENMLLLLLSCTNPLLKSDLVAILIDAQRSITVQTGRTVTLTVGRAFTKLEDIREEFKTVLYASKYRMIYGWNALIDAERTPKPDFDNMMVLSESQELTKYFLKPDIDLVKREILNILNRQRQRPLPMIFQYTYLAILNSIKSVYDQHPPSEEFGLKLVKSFHFELETISEAESWLVSLAEELCSLILSEKIGESTGLFEDIKDYLMSNYSDSSLCLDQIANHFHMSVSHLTGYFRDHSNIGVIAHLDNIRMEVARDILVTTDFQIKQIVKKVGYVDVNNFIRKFRSREGLTPINYRHVHRKAKSL